MNVSDNFYSEQHFKAGQRVGAAGPKALRRENGGAPNDFSGGTLYFSLNLRL